MLAPCAAPNPLHCAAATVAFTRCRLYPPEMKHRTSTLLSHRPTPRLTYTPQPLRSSQLLPPKANKLVNKIQLGGDELSARTTSSPSAALWCNVFSMHLAPWDGNPSKPMGSGCAPQIKVHPWVAEMGWVWEHLLPLICGAMDSAALQATPGDMCQTWPLHPSFHRGWFWQLAFTHSRRLLHLKLCNILFLVPKHVSS